MPRIASVTADGPRLRLPRLRDWCPCCRDGPGIRCAELYVDPGRRQQLVRKISGKPGSGTRKACILILEVYC